ncbi:cellulose binding domain-containing protein [Streptomyces verrucosisporus]|uniref:cellulose-binding domain-containing protein n=1 Tax=Streptomyces verrucosisporus TaxID=1695161 RepID=UPI0019D0E045|nr:cellulose-binding domain-containing protein [Streptomyces verrucosisporus]MBN3932110.1 cellulose binding domain-containing protein [Streptomyces verrucosisporus]
MAGESGEGHGGFPDGAVGRPGPPVGGFSAECSHVGGPAVRLPGGFTADVKITNTGDQAVEGWRLRWDFTAGQRVDQGWSARWSQEGETVTAENLSWNGRLAPGASTTISFNGNSASDNPEPTAFTLNGQECGG